MGEPDPALILVADDDCQVHLLVREILEREGFQIVTAEDGERALELAVERRPALMILDIMMPKMDGYAVLTRLRGHTATREIPAIILTGQTEEIYQGLSEGLGAIAHLTKPFTPERLVAEVRRHLPGKGS